MKTSIKNIAAVAVLTLYTASAHAQLEGSALNYMLQRPRVAKQYADKQLFDHLFVDAGAGVNIVGYNNPDASAHRFARSGGIVAIHISLYRA